MKAEADASLVAVSALAAKIRSGSGCQAARAAMEEDARLAEETRQRDLAEAKANEVAREEAEATQMGSEEELTWLVEVPFRHESIVLSRERRGMGDAAAESEVIEKEARQRLAAELAQMNTEDATSTAIALADRAEMALVAREKREMAEDEELIRAVLRVRRAEHLQRTEELRLMAEEESTQLASVEASLAAALEAAAAEERRLLRKRAIAKVSATASGLGAAVGRSVVRVATAGAQQAAEAEERRRMGEEEVLGAWVIAEETWISGSVAREEAKGHMRAAFLPIGE